MNKARFGVMRPNLSPPKHLPLAARSVSFTVMQPHQCDINIAKKMAQIYWCTAGSATFVLDKKQWELTPFHTCAYPYDSPHHITAHEDGCEFYYWTFDGPIAKGLIEFSPLNDQKVIYRGTPPTSLLRNLEQNMKDNTRETEAKAATIIYELSTLAWQENTEQPIATHDFLQSSIEIMKSQFSDNNLNISSLSNVLNVSRNHFCREFKKRFGYPPSDFLRKIRVQKALELLQHTQQSIHTISQQCGFEDPNYFARILKQDMGYTPSDFRKEVQSKSFI